VLFATGYADAEALIEAGEDRVIRKPFVDDELAAKVAAAVAMSEPHISAMSAQP
jgi:DNA-binding response OmpR family regulator